MNAVIGKVSISSKQNCQNLRIIDKYYKRVSLKMFFFAIIIIIVSSYLNTKAMPTVVIPNFLIKLIECTSK